MKCNEPYSVRAPVSAQRNLVREIDCHPAPPVWFAVLVASCCRAVGQKGTHPIHWTFDSGRALYTNAGLFPERIEEFGVQLDGGGTLSVTWRAGDTAYTVEASVQLEHVA
jgi:hypothetical protein